MSDGGGRRIGFRCQVSGVGGWMADDGNQRTGAEDR